MVVLPAPLGPMSPRICPSWTLRSTPSTARIPPNETLSYAQLAERVNRIANVLTRDFGLVAGNRVLLRGPNNPMMVASILAAIKAGGVVVATMPLLRAKELGYVLNKAKISLALCDGRLAEDMEKARPVAPSASASRVSPSTMYVVQYR